MLRDGRSMYGSLANARKVWKGLRLIAEQRQQLVVVGYYIAEVHLVPDAGFSIEDLREIDQHLTIWGEPDSLAKAVGPIYTADNETN